MKKVPILPNTHNAQYDFTKIRNEFDSISEEEQITLRWRTFFRELIRLYRIYRPDDKSTDAELLYLWLQRLYDSGMLPRDPVSDKYLLPMFHIVAVPLEPKSENRGNS